MKKPLALHRIEGTGRKHRLKKRENELQLDSCVPDAPDWLLPEAKAEWDRIIADEHYARALSTVDRGVLSIYCTLWAKFVIGEEKNTPIGGRQLQTLSAIAAKLGLNPTDRTKIQAPPPPKNVDSPWDRLG